MSDSARPKTKGDKLAAREVNEDLPIEMTAGTPIASTPKAVYIKDSDGYVYECNPGYTDERIENFVGFAVDVATASGSPVSVQTKGIVEGFTGLDAGRLYYLAQDGNLAATPQTKEKIVGVAVSTTALVILHGVVTTSTPQTFYGVKTFDSIPVLPSSTPTSANEATRKSYVDDIIGFPDYTIFAGTCPTSWTDLDLSPITGSPKAFAYLRVTATPGGAMGFKFRTNGETKDVGNTNWYYAGGVTTTYFEDDHCGYVLVITDATGKVEWMGEGSQTAEVKIMGYLRLPIA